MRLILERIRALSRRVVLTATLLCTLCLVVANVRAAEPIRVLFVGNSFTFYNDMPEMLKALAASHSGGPPGPPPRSSILADLALIKDELRFTDNDPVAGHVKFRGVLTDTGLVGIAQVSNAEDKVTAVGSWSLKKN